MILGDGNEQVELSAVPLDDGDFVVSCEARVRQFTGANAAVVVGSEWARFLSDLQVLERDRRGEAALRGSGFDELNLRVFAVDRAGHMAIEGELSDRTVDEGAVLTLKFGPVVFDPSNLASLVAELTPRHSRSNKL